MGGCIGVIKFGEDRVHFYIASFAQELWSFQGLAKAENQGAVIYDVKDDRIESWSNGRAGTPQSLTEAICLARGVRFHDENYSGYAYSPLRSRQADARSNSDQEAIRLYNEGVSIADSHAESAERAFKTGNLDSMLEALKKESGLRVSARKIADLYRLRV